MTREEAIKILKAIRVYECYPKSASEETKEAIDMAIEALKEKNRSDSLVRDEADDCKESESKLDLIRRQDAIKTVIRMCDPICDWELEKKAYTDCVIDEINSLPSAEAVQGEWTDNHNGTFTCDQCGCKHSRSNFCPNCGAKMRGEEE